MANPLPYIVAGDTGEGGKLFAAVDPAAHHVEGEVSKTKLSAWLRPFKTNSDASAALIAAGATIEEGKA